MRQLGREVSFRDVILVPDWLREAARTATSAARRSQPRAGNKDLAVQISLLGTLLPAADCSRLTKDAALDALVLAGEIAEGLRRQGSLLLALAFQGLEAMLLEAALGDESDRAS